MLGVAVQPHPAARLCPGGVAARRRHELRAASAAAHQRASSERAAENEHRRAASVDDSPSQRAAAHRASTEAKRAQRRSAQAQAEAWEDAAKKKLDSAAATRDQWVALRTKPREDPTAAANALEEKRARERQAQQREQRDERQRQEAEAARQQLAERRNVQHVAARQRNAARLNARVASTAAARSEWDTQVAAAQAPPRSRRPAWARINERREKQQEVIPSVDPTEYAKKQAAARAFAVEKRAVTNTQVFRWRNAELIEIESLRDRAEFRGISRLEARPDLEARIAFDMAAGQAPYSYNVGELLGQAE